MGGEEENRTGEKKRGEKKREKKRGEKKRGKFPPLVIPAFTFASVLLIPAFTFAFASTTCAFPPPA